MNKAISLALLAGGIILLILGIHAYNSTSSDISRFFTGSATDKSIWMLLGGVVAIVLGLVGLRGVSSKSATLLILFIGLQAGLWAEPQQAIAQTESVNHQVFYDALSSSCRTCNADSRTGRGNDRAQDVP